MNYSLKQSLNCIGIAKPYHENLFIIGDDKNREDITCLVKLDKELNPIWGSKKTQEDYFEIFNNILIFKTSKKTFDVYNIADMSLLYTISTDYELGRFMAEPSKPDIFYNIAMKSIYVYNKQDGTLLRTIKRCKGYVAKVMDNGFIVDDFAGNCSLVDKESMQVLWKYSFEDGFFKN